MVVKGTRQNGYLGGDYEGRQGTIVSATKVSGEFEQSVMLRFDDGEQRGILAKNFEPMQPAHMNDEAVVVEGKDKGKVVMVRETPDSEMVTVSTKEEPTGVFEVPRDRLILLS